MTPGTRVRDLHVDAHTILIEQSPQGAAHVAGWTISFDGTITAIADLEAAIQLAVEMGTKAWAIDRRPVRILLKDADRTIEVGRFEDPAALERAS